MVNWKETTIGKPVNGVGREIDYDAKPVTSLPMYCRQELDMNGDFLGQWKDLPEKDKADLKEAALAEIKAHNVPMDIKK